MRTSSRCHFRAPLNVRCVWFLASQLVEIEKQSKAGGSAVVICQSSEVLFLRGNWGVQCIIQFFFYSLILSTNTYLIIYICQELSSVLEIVNQIHSFACKDLIIFLKAQIWIK